MIETCENETTVRIILESDLDAGHVSSLRPQLRELLDKKYTQFIFDFARARFMCSAGLGLLVEVYNDVSRRDGSVLLENLNKHLTQLLTDTKLLDLFTARQKADDSTRLSALDAVQRQMSQELLFLSYINTITSSVLQADITEDICELTLEGVLRSLSCRRGMLLLIQDDSAGPAFHVAAAEGFAPEVCCLVEDMPLDDDSLEQRSLNAMQAQLISSDTPDLGARSPLLETTGIRDGILTPMVGREEPIGILLIEAPQNAPSFFQQSPPLVQVFANVCGLAVEKQSLVDHIQYKNAQLSRTLSELNKTQAALMEAGKLAALGALSRGLGHALNNKLVPIMGYTQMIRMQLDPDSDLSRKVKIIDSAALDIKRIIDNLRAAARKEELEIGAHDLREIADSALFMLDYMFRDEKILVERAYADKDCIAEVDRARMVQAFLALFQRLPEAFHHVPERRLRIEISRHEGQVQAKVIDSGRTIPAEELERVLDPFSESVSRTEFDRFNFSIASGIIRDHHGTVAVEPNPETGMCVIMTIPVAQIKKHSPKGA